LFTRVALYCEEPVLEITAHENKVTGVSFFVYVAREVASLQYSA